MLRKEILEIMRERLVRFDERTTEDEKALCELNKKRKIFREKKREEKYVPCAPITILETVFYWTTVNPMLARRLYPTLWYAVFLLKFFIFSYSIIKRTFHCHYFSYTNTFEKWFFKFKFRP